MEKKLPNVFWRTVHHPLSEHILCRKITTGVVGTIIPAILLIRLEKFSDIPGKNGAEAIILLYIAISLLITLWGVWELILLRKGHKLRALYSKNISCVALHRRLTSKKYFWIMVPLIALLFATLLNRIYTQAHPETGLGTLTIAVLLTAVPFLQFLFGYEKIYSMMTRYRWTRLRMRHFPIFATLKPQILKKDIEPPYLEHIAQK